MAVLLALVQHPGATAQTDLPALTGLSAQTTSDAVRRLEDAGVIHGSLPRTHRRGHSVEWTLDHEAIAAVMGDLATGLAPPTTTQ